MKYKMMLVLLCLGLSLGLSGCEKEKTDHNSLSSQTDDNLKSEEGNTQPESNSYQFPAEYKGEVDQIKYETVIHLDEKRKDNKIRDARGVLQKKDHEKMYQVLFENLELKEYSTGEEYTDSYGNKEEDHIYEGKNGENFSTVGVPNFSTPLARYINNSFRLEENMDHFSTDKDLDFMTREKALEDIKKKLKMMGFDLGEIDYNCYALDYQTMEKEEYAINHDGEIDKSVYKPSWGKEDDSYFFFIRQKIDGAPEYHPFSNLFKNASDENAPIQVLYSKDGIQELSIEGVYSFELNKDFLELAPFETIVETVSKKYGMLLNTATYTVTDATLYQMTEYTEPGVCVSKPVWILDILERVEEENIENKLMTIVDAVTGDEIPMEDKY